MSWSVEELTFFQNCGARGARGCCTAALYTFIDSLFSSASEPRIRFARSESLAVPLRLRFGRAFSTLPVVRFCCCTNAG